MAEPVSRGSATEGAKNDLVGQVANFLRVSIRNRALMREMVARDLKGGVAGHGFGVAWVFIQPLVIVLTYMLVFGVVIGSKIAVTSTFPGDYISYIMAGLVPWLIMSNALGRAPSVFMSNANLVKQVVFPVEILLVANVVACFLVFVPSIALMLAYKLFFGGGLAPVIVLLPAVIVMHMVFSLGLMMILSVITPFIRDIREFVTVYSAISMYFTPAIYLPDWVPAAIRPVLYLNPFSYVVWVYQDVLFFGRIDHGFAWIVFAVMTIATFLGGLTVFRRVKPFLGNVI
jgi:lipopolysaccharide transport system permease protein